MNRCPMCGRGEIHRETRSVEYKFQGRSITVEQSGLYCDKCGDALLEAGDLASNRQALLDLLSKSERSGIIMDGWEEWFNSNELPMSDLLIDRSARPDLNLETIAAIHRFVFLLEERLGYGNVTGVRASCDGGVSLALSFQDGGADSEVMEAVAHDVLEEMEVRIVPIVATDPNDYADWIDML